ncbi:hypothetical protein, partial [Salmonella enterica]|uniref:hypothetical protein n=1 Tax=Salmonella enterica TaxID=28901 RepID=UPI00329773C6
RESRVEGLEVRQVQPPMERGQRPVCNVPDQREMQDVKVEVKDIELVGQAADLVQHQDVEGNGIPHVGIQPQ